MLIPLFGVTYLIVLFCPGGEGITQNVFENLRVFLISTQACIPYILKLPLKLYIQYIDMRYIYRL